MRRISGWLLGAIVGAVPLPAAAQTPPYPKEIQAALDFERKTCLEEGGSAIRFAPNIVRKIDLNGDGRDDYIVDLHDTECEGRLSVFCGTGGCNFEIFIAQRNGSFRSIFGDRIRRHEILPGRGARTIKFWLHGGYCGRGGADSCVKTRRITGKPFEYKDR